MTQFGILFLTIFSCGIVAAFVYGPAWAFYLYELIYFLNPGNRWWGNGIPNISYSFYTTLTMLILTAIHWKKHQNSIKEMPELKWFLGLILSYLIVTPFALNDMMHQRFLMYLTTYWAVVIIAYYILDSTKKVELAMLFFMLGAAYIGYEAHNVGRNAFGRIDNIGTLDSPEANTIAASIVPALAFCAFFIWHGNYKIKACALVCAALLANGLILINSRGAFLATIVSLSYFGLHMMFAKYKLPKQRLFLVAFIIIGLAGVIKIADATFWERMATLRTQSSIDSEGSGGRRINFWIATFDMLKSHPTGMGIWGYETISFNYLPEEYMADEFGERVRSVHSIWFQSLGEIGWLGFFMFMGLLLSIKMHLRKAKKALIQANMLRNYYMIICIESSAVAFFVASSFINMFRSNILYLLVTIGICAAVTGLRLANEKTSESPEFKRKNYMSTRNENINKSSI